MVVIHPLAQVFVDFTAIAKSLPVAESINETRASVEQMQGSTNPPLDSVDHETLDIPVGPTGSVNIHIYKPKGSKGLVPTIVYIHGGYPN